MIFENYNNLLKPSDLDNFKISLAKPNGYTFNSLINILKDENIPYEVVEGYNYQSNDEDLAEFNKIEFRFNNIDLIDNVCKEYSLDEVFKINKKGNIYTFLII